MNLSPSTQFQKTDLLTQFDLALAETLERHWAAPDGVTPPSLRESIQYSLLAPGKKIRPRLLLSCGEMLGLSSAVTLPTAVAIEMIHCFTLIHDDLPCMDDDDFRRGQPSNHKKFGETTALLAGDALIALAFDVFLDAPVDPARLRVALKRLAWAAGPRGVIGGQAAESDLGQNSTLEQLSQMHRQKTGALFIASLLIPKDLAGVSDSSPEGQSILSFADELGLAFQIADDLEDLYEAPSGSFAPDPTSILYFLSPEEARKKTIHRLGQASQRLAHAWGERARALCHIAEEVIRKLQETQT